MGAHAVLTLLSTALVFIFSIYALLFFIFTILLVSRKNAQPIRFRGPALLIASSIGSFALSVWLVVYLSCRAGIFSVSCQEMFCTVWEWLTAGFYPIYILPYLLRGYRILKLVNNISTDNLLQVKYYERRPVRETDLMYIVIAGGAAAMIILAALKILGLDPKISGFACDNFHEYTPLAWVFWSCWHLGIVCTLVYMAQRFQSIREDYGMVNEFLSIAAIWAVTALGNLISMTIVEGDYEDKNAELNVSIDIHAIIVVLRDMTIFCISIVYPVLASYASVYTPLWADSDALRSMHSILHDITCMNYFHQFLTAESTVEYLLCWVEIDVCTEIDDIEELKFAVETIYNKYLADRAPYEVHVDIMAKNVVFDILYMDNVPPSEYIRALEGVKSELYQIMNAQFPRFLSSEYCRTCLHELQNEEILREMMERSDMI